MQEDPEKVTYFAQTDSRGAATPFGIKRKDRARHMYVIGKTGMGKSTLLENMAIQDIRNGEGIAFIDPHGSTAERLLEYVPEHRVKDVLYFAPFDMEYPVAFNVMEDVGYDKRHLVVSGLLSAFRKIWVDAWSARMEYILQNTLLALLEYPGATLLDVNRMLVNKTFRAKVVDNVKDPVVKAFWVEEFATYTDRYTQEATPAIQNKIGQFTSNPLIRNIIGQAKSSFDLRQMMDDKKIIIMNLSKGRVGEVNATLLGSMLVTKIYLAAMSRADVSQAVLKGLPNFYFYVDEFQSFANQSFADILSEARKYKLNLIIAHQYVEQMEEEVRDAVFGNVGTTVVFRVGPFDAEVLETIFMPKFTKEDLVNLGFAQIYLTLMIDGVGSPPFSATTLPPFDQAPHRFVPQVVAKSREQFGRPRLEVERVIGEWQAQDAPPPKAPKPAPRERPPMQSASAAPRPAPQPVAFTSAPAVAPRPVNAPPSTMPQSTPHRAEVPHAPKPQPREQAPKRETPPLEGATSLREALEKATHSHLPEKKDAAPAPKQEPKREHKGGGNHAPDLKNVLSSLAPKAAAEKPAEAKRDAKPAPPQNHNDKKNGIPEDELRRMLAVDDVHETE